jgi:CRP/FNR family transcriptional regulator, cyclic AMP receptor protein
MIPIEKLRHYGAAKINCRKDSIIFHEGEKATYYFQLEEGSVKLITRSATGREFIQGIFGACESFGEPPLLADFDYPSSAVALTPVTLYRLAKENFVQLLQENFTIHLQFDSILAERLRQKSKILSDISFYEPDQRILNLIHQMKKKYGEIGSQSFIVPLTRQQLADMTGMRVETAIRAIKRMEEEEKLTIIDGKIHA